MAKERLTAGETMGLMEELDRYPTGSIYPVTRKGKNGESIPNGYAISFYYDSLDGKKQKKTCTAKSEEALIPLRTKFLTELFYEKLALRKKEENIELLKEAIRLSKCFLAIISEKHLRNN